jgi:hypothetical protein
VSPRPLVRRRPDGTRYVDPLGLPNPRPRYSSRLPPQPAREAPSDPEPTTPKPRRGGHPPVSDTTVLEMRAEYATGKWTIRELAYIFDLSYSKVRGIVLGHTYQDVKPPEPQED